MQRVHEETPFSLCIDIQKEILNFGVEQKMNDYVGIQKTIIPILEQEGFFKEVIKLKELKIAIIKSLPELISKAHLSHDDVMNFHGNSPKYAYFVLEVELNGLSVRIRIDVKKTSAKNKFWLHMIDINEKNPITQS